MNPEQILRQNLIETLLRLEVPASEAIGQATPLLIWILGSNGPSKPSYSDEKG